MQMICACVCVTSDTRLFNPMCMSKCVLDDAYVTSYACFCVTTFILSFTLSSCCGCLSRVGYASICISCGVTNSYLVESVFLTRVFTTGSTLITRKYLDKDMTAYDEKPDCTGEYTIETAIIGACSSGVKYQIVGTASPVPSLAPTAALSGYYVTARYSDAKCALIESAVSYPLNSCNDDADGLGGYVKYTATASAIARTEYSDSSCTTAVSELGPIYLDYTGTCVDSSEAPVYIASSLASVNSNGDPISSLTMASIRLVLIISLSCVMASHILFLLSLAQKQPLLLACK